MSQESSSIGRFVQGPLLAGGLVVLITEGLGALSLLQPIPVGLAWLCVGLGWLYMVRRFPEVWRWRPGPRDGIRDAPVLWSVVSLLLALTFLTGFFGAPNVWDGLTYHLPRVERWVEQGHLGFWPTSVDRQLWMAPFGSYAMLQFRLLTGGDRLAFLPSWLAYCGLILLAARVVRQLGGTGSQGAFGALVMATMPVAVLQASSVQTDLLTAFWVMCVAALSLEAWQHREVAGHWRHASWFAVAVALSVATKGTSWLAMAPWLALYGAAAVRAGGRKAAVRPLLIGLAVLLVLNGVHFARNVALFGDPLGDATTRGFLRLTPWTISGAIANLVANLSLHLGTPWTAWNEWWTDALVVAQRTVLGADPGVLFQYFGGFRVPPYSTHEALAGNPAHLLLGVITLLMFTVRGRAVRGSASGPWVVAGLAAVILHMTMVRWQPYGARLQLASLVWLAPLAATLVRNSPSRAILAALISLSAIPAGVMNHLRPFLGEGSVFSVPRQEQYFAERPFIRSSLEMVSARLDHESCAEVGLGAGYDTPEYFVRVANRVYQDHVRLRYLEPASPSARLATPSEADGVCALLVITAPPGWQVPAQASGMRVAYVDAHVALFLGRLHGGAAEVPRP